MNKTYEAAKASIKGCMGMKAGEKLLILTDTEQLALAAEFVKAGNDLGYETSMVCGPVRLSGEMPEVSGAALAKADAAMMITTGSFTHTAAGQRPRSGAAGSPPCPALRRRSCRILSMLTTTTWSVSATFWRRS